MLLIRKNCFLEDLREDENQNFDCLQNLVGNSPGAALSHRQRHLRNDERLEVLDGNVQDFATWRIFVEQQKCVLWEDWSEARKVTRLFGVWHNSQRGAPNKGKALENLLFNVFREFTNFIYLQRLTMRKSKILFYKYFVWTISSWREIFQHFLENKIKIQIK